MIDKCAISGCTGKPFRGVARMKKDGSGRDMIDQEKSFKYCKEHWKVLGGNYKNEEHI